MFSKRKLKYYLQERRSSTYYQVLFKTVMMFSIVLRFMSCVWILCVSMHFVTAQDDVRVFGTFGGNVSITLSFTEAMFGEFHECLCEGLTTCSATHDSSQSSSYYKVTNITHSGSVDTSPENPVTYSCEHLTNLNSMTCTRFLQYNNASGNDSMEIAQSTFVLSNSGPSCNETCIGLVWPSGYDGILFSYSILPSLQYCDANCSSCSAASFSPLLSSTLPLKSTSPSTLSSMLTSSSTSSSRMTSSSTLSPTSVSSSTSSSRSTSSSTLSSTQALSTTSSSTSKVSFTSSSKVTSTRSSVSSTTTMLHQTIAKSSTESPAEVSKPLLPIPDKENVADEDVDGNVDDDLSAGSIIGIVLGIIVIAVIVTTIVVVFLRRKKALKRSRVGELNTTKPASFNGLKLQLNKKQDTEHPYVRMPSPDMPDPHAVNKDNNKLSCKNTEFKPRVSDNGLETKQHSSIHQKDIAAKEDGLNDYLIPRTPVPSEDMDCNKIANDIDSIKRQASDYGLETGDHLNKQQGAIATENDGGYSNIPPVSYKIMSYDDTVDNTTSAGTRDPTFRNINDAQNDDAHVVSSPVQDKSKHNENFGTSSVNPSKSTAQKADADHEYASIDDETVVPATKAHRRQSGSRSRPDSMSLPPPPSVSETLPTSTKGPKDDWYDSDNTYVAPDPKDDCNGSTYATPDQIVTGNASSASA